MTELTCFKAYDVRGKLGTEITPDSAYRIARAYAQWLKPHTIVLGGDIRETSASLKTALSNGLRDAGVDVLDLGMVGTEEVYFATWHLKASGGIEVTASHNPIDYNGFKLVREQARPISADTGLQEIRALAQSEDFPEPVSPRGDYQVVDNREAYIEHLLTYLDASALKPLRLVVNAGNGAAGPVVDALESAFQARQIPVELIKINHEPNGQFPNGIPNPMLIENREVTRSAFLQHKADLGIAWDGDFDRCFLFDEKGQFIEGYYIVGLLAEAFLQKEAGAGIIHDPRLTWNTLDIVASNGGKAIQCKSGHAFIKQAMRENNAAYGGEMSAHHYFRDFAYCDSGMIPWLLVIELLSRKGQTLSELVSQCIAAYPSSGEINLKVADAKQAIQLIRDRYAPSASQIDETDGLSLEYPQWRFNLRASNTEPVIRLNVESRGDITLMQFKTREILDLLESN